MRALYRVTYPKDGQDVSSLVVAQNGYDAVAFCGAQNVSASVSLAAGLVEVVGLDKAHAVIVPPMIYVQPPEPPKQLSDAELAQLRALLAAQAQ